MTVLSAIIVVACVVAIVVVVRASVWAIEDMRREGDDE